MCTNNGLAVALDEVFKHVFEGTTEEMVKWLRAGSPDYVDLYLVKDVEGRILTVTEFLCVNNVESQLETTPPPCPKWGW